MQRMSWSGKAIAWAGLFAFGASALAQQPVPGGLPGGPLAEPPGMLPGGSVVPNGFGQAPPEGAIAPRTDVYSNYSDAYMNPEAAAPYGAPGVGAGGAAAAVDSAIRGPKYWRLYGGADVLNYRRSRPGNKILLRTTPNLFDTTPDFNNPQQLVAPNANGATGIFPNSQVGSPREGLPFFANDPDARINVDEFLVPNETRFQTDDFENPSTTGYRYRLGIELASGNSIEFNYSYVADIEARFVDDVSGAAFLTFQISDPDVPTYAYYFRFGYLNAPFRLPVNNAGQTPDPFGGEIRLSLNDSPPPTASPPGSNATAPHYPLNESPALNNGPTPLAPITVFADGPGTFPGGGIIPAADNGIRSTDIPREPTNEDVRVLGATDPRYAFSLLWTDGELAVIDYNFDMQNAELVYRRRIFEYELADWRLDLLTGVRYVALDEQFNFYFADIAGGGPNSPVQPRNPFDRAAANPTQPRAQSSDQASATYVAGIENDLVGPELGLAAKYPFLGVFEFDLMTKASFAANFLRNRQAIIRGDGLELYDYQKTVQSTSGILEGRLGLTLTLLPNLTLHGGWEYMWLVNVGSAINQIEFDLTRRPRPSNEEKLLWHGWYGGFELTY